MKPIRNLLALLALVAFIAGCASLYTGTVTLTKIVDTSMNAWADLSNTGHTTPDLDAKVMRAHARYKQLAVIAGHALQTYKASGGTGDQANYVAAFEAVRQAALDLIGVLEDLLPKANVAKAKSDLTATTKL